MAKLQIKQTRSIIGKSKKQIATIQALGLKKIGQVVEKEDTPQIRGMIEKVNHMVTVIN